MSKILKKFLMFFIFLCIAVLLILVVEIFVLNRKAGDGAEESPAVSDSRQSEEPDGSLPPTPAQPGTPETADGPEDTAAQAGDAGEQTGGTRFEMPLSPVEKLGITVDETLFEHLMLDMSDAFVYKAQESVTLEISFADGGTAQQLAPGFLDNYIDFTGGGLSNEGYSSIAGSELGGEHVIAKSVEGETYEAWLMDLDNAVLAFVINYWDDTQKNALYDVLDTLTISSAE